MRQRRLGFSSSCKGDLGKYQKCGEASLFVNRRDWGQGEHSYGVSESGVAEEPDKSLSSAPERLTDVVQECWGEPDPWLQEWGGSVDVTALLVGGGMSTWMRTECSPRTRPCSLLSMPDLTH